MAEPPQVAHETEPEHREPATSESAETAENLDDLEEVEAPDQAPGPQFSNEEHRASHQIAGALAFRGAHQQLCRSHRLYYVPCTRQAQLC